MTAVVRAASLSNYSEVARSVGLDPLQELRKVGLDSHAVSDPDMRIPARAVSELLAASAEKASCENFGLRMAESRQLSNFGAISLLISRQPTLREIMATLAQYRNLLNESLVVDIETAGDLVIVREELEVQTNSSLRQSYELAVGTLFRAMRAILGNGWRPVSVNFTHEPPSDLAVHRRLFGPIVEFKSMFNGIVFLTVDFDKPNPAADPMLARYAKQYLESLPKSGVETMTREVRKTIYLLLPMGGSSITRVAESMGVNVRTLQRRLEAEDAEFSQLVNVVRRDLAVRYLKDSRDSRTQIAESLGYTQISSFTRWFHAEFGIAPARWREQAAGDELARGKGPSKNTPKPE
jgi:AraC-like DNA-binding protein